MKSIRDMLYAVNAAYPTGPRPEGLVGPAAWVTQLETGRFGPSGAAEGTFCGFTFRRDPTIPPNEIRIMRGGRVEASYDFTPP